MLSRPVSVVYSAVSDEFATICAIPLSVTDNVVPESVPYVSVGWERSNHANTGS